MPCFLSDRITPPVNSGKEARLSGGGRRFLFVEVAAEKEIFIDNLLVRDHLIIEMILVDRPCATGV